MDTFYQKTLRQLIEKGAVRADMSILVICGSRLDRDVLNAAGFTNVTITNLDERHNRSDLNPYAWDHQNAEALTYEDNQFDVVVVHLGLHHCRQPHRALCEMYRVSRMGILVIEPCRNVLVSIGQWLGIGQTYEVHAVAANNRISGGVNNGPIPNYVYRWTPTEIADTLRADRPEFPVRYWTRYDLVIHWHDLRRKRNKLPLLCAVLAWPALWVINRVVPIVANNIAVFVEKLTTPHPWLEQSDEGVILPNSLWFDRFIE